MTKYDEIKKGATFSPNKYLMFAKKKGDISLSVFPEELNEVIKTEIIDIHPNKNYYLDDGVYTIKISTQEKSGEIEYSYFIKYNTKEKPAAPKTSYQNYLKSTSLYMITIGIVILSLLIFSFPILKGFFG